MPKRDQRLTLGEGATVRLAIADPPYPRFVGAGGPKQRASRWYGSNPRARATTGAPTTIPTPTGGTSPLRTAS